MELKEKRVKGDSQAWKDSQVCLGFQAQKDLLVQEVQRVMMDFQDLLAPKESEDHQGFRDFQELQDFLVYQDKMGHQDLRVSRAAMERRENVDSQAVQVFQVYKGLLGPLVCQV